ncbi:MAG: MBL fold metallo-hydrolase [Rhizobiales bacterium 32-66-8]|nr:MAG: MBL fold metallo-hydrolase [Rhizobiales bacterium 32-66-8]
MRKHSDTVVIDSPAADRSETIELPVSCFLMRHPQGNVLFDTGCHPSVASDAEARWGSMARAMTPLMSGDDTVLSGLACIGLGADDIDVVVCSHFHPDHCGCNAFFKKATFLVHARELAAAKADKAESAGYLPVEWDHPMPMETLDGQRDLFGDGRIVLIPLPGHTPGLTGALVSLDRDGQFLLASDAVSLRSTLTQNIVPKNTWNPDQFLESVTEIRRIETSGARVLCGHDDEQWASLRKGPDAYD